MMQSIWWLDGDQISTHLSDVSALSEDLAVNENWKLASSEACNRVFALLRVCMGGDGTSVDPC